MVDDVFDLLGKQARIDGIDDRAHTRHREIKLEMAVRVTSQRPDGRRLHDAKRAERVRKLTRAPMCVTIRVAMDLAGSQAGDDFGIAVICIRVAQ